MCRIVSGMNVDVPFNCRVRSEVPPVLYVVSARVAIRCDSVTDLLSKDKMTWRLNRCSVLP